MPEIDDLRKSIEDEISDYSEYLRRLKPLVDVVPLVSDRLRDAQAKLVVINNAPKDFLSEISPRLLSIQREEEQARASWLPILPDKDFSYAARISSGTSSDYYEAVVKPLAYEPSNAAWLDPITEVYVTIANERAKSYQVTVLAGAIHPDLPAEFASAVNSVTMARERIVGVDQALIRLRDFIEGLWGGLATHARALPDPTPWPSSLNLRNGAHRGRVARSLGGSIQATLERHLEDLNTLHRDLSAPAKDILADDVPALDSFYARWVLLVHEILAQVAHPPEPPAGAA